MNSGICEEPERQPLFFIFESSSEGRVLVPGAEKIPPASRSSEFTKFLISSGPVTKQDGGDIWGLASEDFAEAEKDSFISRRELPALFGFEIFNRSGIAYQMMNLTVKNKFCGACGETMTDHASDRARFCPACGNTVYPVLADAVIVAVEKDGMLLMGHNVNFPPERYSVLAGFAEPGETLEETVAREVYEESRVKIKNVRYFGSQPWPFPNSMMLGFTAEWESGDPTPDGGELSDVRWFAPDKLPGLPPPVSISRKLIDAWLNRVS